MGLDPNLRWQEEHVKVDRTAGGLCRLKRVGKRKIERGKERKGDTETETCDVPGGAFELNAKSLSRGRDNTRDTINLIDVINLINFLIVSKVRRMCCLETYNVDDGDLHYKQASHITLFNVCTYVAPVSVDGISKAQK